MLVSEILGKFDPRRIWYRYLHVDEINCAGALSLIFGREVGHVTGDGPFFPCAMDIYGAKIIWTTASTVLLSNVMSYPHTHILWMHMQLAAVLDLTRP